ncbi:sensory neuron membrane protein 2 [Aethina tumida]|uniref:sensory neuron membrane protein 2 n=1 Tax=Aethina tumida TaxID=116153 RepID=UPI00214730B5|nr:sensory neuron membrane protein 2 [Aethina tumida]
MSLLKWFSIRSLSIIFGIFLVLLTGGLVFGFYGLPKIIEMQVRTSVRLEEGTEQWDRFVETPFPIDFRVYIFQILNKDDVLNNGAKPELKETGPFVYKEYRKKTILETDSETDTVSYTQNLTFEFFEDESVASDNTEVTVLNPVLLATIQQAESLQKGFLNKYIYKVFQDINGLFITVKVKDLLFNGIPFAKKNSCNDLPTLEIIVCNLVLDTVTQQASVLKTVREENDILYFSFFEYKAARNDGVYTVNRGISDSSLLGTIQEWNNSTDTDFWGSASSTNNETCSKVRGTDSTIYPPKVGDLDGVDIFNTDICRVVYLERSGQQTYSDIEGYRFQSNKNTYRYSTSTAEEDCFCIQKTSDINNEDNCYLDGVIDMQSCVGSPLLFSLPHFLWADDKYLDGVKGLSPDPDKHMLFLNVEPNTGTPLQGAKRLQLNMVLKPDEKIDMAKNLPKVVYPMLWVEESMKLPPKYVDKLNDDYFSKVNLGNIAKISIIVVTSILMVFFGVLLGVKVVKGRNFQV